MEYSSDKPQACYMLQHLHLHKFEQSHRLLITTQAHKVNVDPSIMIGICIMSIYRVKSTTKYRE